MYLRLQVHGRLRRRRLTRSYHIRVRTPEGRLEEALSALVTPVLHEVGSLAGVDAAYFARYLREALLFVQGEAGSLAETARIVERHLEPLLRDGIVEGSVQPEYHREIERYGGTTGMFLAERIFHEDSIACLALLEAERRGECARTRREFELVLAERLLDLLGFDRARRIACYRYGYAWALDQRRWEEADLQLLEQRFQALRPGLAALLREPLDAEPGRIAEAWIERTRPLIARLLEAHAAGEVRQDLIPLAWSYSHMQCNRLGITGDAEAILRFFMQRLHEEGEGGVV
ncbi:MAG TPA: thiopeptide-type bacteriocin biosynthesis protein [Candidatus Polarisedimenticolaceae bacterium]|nr:thiopeptide-type bacteriocin biosynthesis protein [Candidatus Polarisedimenticolaceae bacterium]